MTRPQKRDSSLFQRFEELPNRGQLSQTRQKILLSGLCNQSPRNSPRFGREPHHSRRSIFPGWVNIQLELPPTGGRAAGSGIFASIKTAGADTNSSVGSSLKARLAAPGWEANLAGFDGQGNLSFPLPKRPRRLVVFLREASEFLCFTIVCVKMDNLE